MPSAVPVAAALPAAATATPATPTTAPAATTATTPTAATATTPTAATAAVDTSAPATLCIGNASKARKRNRRDECKH
jgi:hypothetical protein